MDRRHRAPQVRPPMWWGYACSLAALGSMMLVVVLWISGGGPAELIQGGTAMASVGRLSGLVASDLLLIQVLLMARIPLVEMTFGQDELARSHQMGSWSFILMLVHIVAILVGYSATTRRGLWGTVVDFVVKYPGGLLALAGLVALAGVILSSTLAARARLRYESWHLLHLYAYLGLGLVLPHQLWTGKEFLSSPLATAFWWTMWASAAVSVLIWRVGQPLWRSWRHQLMIEEVRPESERVTTIVMSGRRLDRLPAQAGQYFQWRFLDGPGMTRAHPYSLSAEPDGQTLRITVAHLGDGSEAVARLHPGMRVLFEGPYGRLHSGVRTRRKVLLMASGIGVTPMRALLEELGRRPGSITLVYRVRSDREGYLVDELTELAERHGARLFVVTGHRVAARNSWLPQALADYGDVEALRQLVPDIADHDVYLCGGPGWLEAAELAVTKAGVPAEHLHIEHFSS
jgi:ferredoxin-NADP reductase/DMSO/TMAO reductase YedYZ heme-binding membrane subunit